MVIMVTYTNTIPSKSASEWQTYEARDAQSASVQLAAAGAGSNVISDSAKLVTVAAASGAMTDALVYARFVARQALIKSPIAITVKAYVGGTYNTTGPAYTGGTCRGVWELAAGESVTLAVRCDCLKLTTAGVTTDDIQILFSEDR